MLGKRPVIIHYCIMFYSLYYRVGQTHVTRRTQAHWTMKSELPTQQGFLLWGNRVIVPPSLQQKILQKLLDSDVQISLMKSLG